MRSDWSIRFEICELVGKSPEIDPERIHISVEDGIVRLLGHVVSRRAHTALVQLAARVRGVQAIDDQISE